MFYYKKSTTCQNIVLISNACGVMIHVVLKLCEGALAGFAFVHIFIEDDLQVQLVSLFGVVVKD